MRVTHGPVFFWLDMPTDAENLLAAEEAILNGLSRPQRLRSREGEEIQERSTKDAIDAANYFAGKAALASGRSGLRFFQFTPPGGGGTE